MGLEIKPFDPALFITIPYCSTPPMILPITSLLWAPRGCWRRAGVGFQSVVAWLPLPSPLRGLPHCEAHLLGLGAQFKETGGVQIKTGREVG